MIMKNDYSKRSMPLNWGVSKSLTTSQLFAARKRGAAILLISEDLDELLSLCDRIAVMYQGSLSEAVPPAARTIVTSSAL